MGKSENHVKITSGTYRGQKINTPGEGTHPMGERERIALFNMIADNLTDAQILDTYAGSGALGIEALSRGAKEVLFIDQSHVAMRTIVENCMRLGLAEEQVAFYRGEVEAFYMKFIQGHGRAVHPGMAMALATFPTEFDVILADPPYDDFDPETIEKLGTCLKNDGVLVLSHPDDAPELDGLTLQKSHQYAAAHLSIYTKA